MWVIGLLSLKKWLVAEGPVNMFSFCCSLYDVIHDEDHYRPPCAYGNSWDEVWRIDHLWCLQFLIDEWRVRLYVAFVISKSNFRFAMWLTGLPKCRLHGFRWTVKRTHKWVRGSVDKSRFQILSAKLVSEGGIPSPVVLACAFLTWQSLETMAKREQSRHSSAVT